MQSNKKLDTLALIDFDSSESKVEDIKQIILVTESKGEKTKSWYENSVLVSFGYPMLTAIVVIIITRLFDLNKNKIVKKQYKKQTKKIKEETKNLKRSFQPIVIATIQATQDKLLDKKIEALEEVNRLSNEFLTYPDSYFEGEIVIPHISEIADHIFMSYRREYSISFNDFHDKYAYMFSNELLQTSNKLRSSLEDFTHHFFGFMDATEGDMSRISNMDRESVKNLIKLYDRTIDLLRKDCFIDTKLIHKFIEENK